MLDIAQQYMLGFNVKNLICSLCRKALRKFSDDTTNGAFVI